MTDLSERVCPRCGEPASERRFCGTCGLNLAEQSEVPTRAEWEASQAGQVSPAGSSEPMPGHLGQTSAQPEESGLNADSTWRFRW
jgi:hypothetical protein